MDIEYVDRAIDVLVEKVKIAKERSIEAEAAEVEARQIAESAADDLLRLLNALRLLDQAKKNLVSSTNQGTNLG